MEWCEHCKWNDSEYKWTEFGQNFFVRGWKFCPICAAPRPKEEKKLWQVLEDKWIKDRESGLGTRESHWNQAQAAIEAVIKVYEEWEGFSSRKFQDYLKEKLL